MKVQQGTRSTASNHPSAATALNAEGHHRAPNYRTCFRDTTTNVGASWWLTARIEPQSSLKSRCTRLYTGFLAPFFYSTGQCGFGLAMISIIAGVTLCIWGFAGSSTRAFQIAGPLCITAGVLIYIIGCFVCCGECSNLENALAQKALENKTTNALGYLAKEEVIRWIQTEQNIFEEFRQVSVAILNSNR